MRHAKYSILFLPGLLCDERIWRDQAADLHDIADATIADLTLDDSVGAMADRALAGAPKRFVLIGLSMGGYVALEIMRRAPERVIALMLFDTSARPDSAERVQRRLAGMASLKVGKFAGVTGRLLPQLVHPSHVDGPVGRELQEMARRVGGEAFLRQQQAILDRPDFRPSLAAISVPTLVAVGDRDVLTPPADALELHIGIATSELLVIRNCGHLPAIEKPERTAKIIRGFLSAAIVGSD